MPLIKASRYLDTAEETETHCPMTSGISKVSPPRELLITGYVLIVRTIWHQHPCHPFSESLRSSLLDSNFSRVVLTISTSLISSCYHVITALWCCLLLRFCLFFISVRDWRASVYYTLSSSIWFLINIHPPCRKKDGFSNNIWCHFWIFLLKSNGLGFTHMGLTPTSGTQLINDQIKSPHLEMLQTEITLMTRTERDKESAVYARGVRQFILFQTAWWGKQQSGNSSQLIISLHYNNMNLMLMSIHKELSSVFMGLRDFVSKQATTQDKKSSNAFVVRLWYMNNYEQLKCWFTRLYFNGFGITTQNNEGWSKANCDISHWEASFNRTTGGKNALWQITKTNLCWFFVQNNCMIIIPEYLFTSKQNPSMYFLLLIQL